MADIKDYTGKITSQHSDKPKYMAMVEAVSQCFLDTNEVASGLPEDFDLDSAVDAQLDDVGLWVGISRNIATPLTNVYFSLDTAGLGFDQGAWKGPFDPDNGITTLDNEAYRTLLRAKIGANHWDGTMESSKAILDLVFNPDGHAPFYPVTANNETFGVGDGVQTAFQLKYQGQNVYSYTSATLYRTDWQGKQQLYPTPRTNIALQSNVFSNGAWTKQNTSVATGIVLAPDGTPAFRMTENAANTTHLVQQNGKVVAGNTTYCRSIFAKADSAGRYLYLDSASISNWTNVCSATFDLMNGVILSVSGTPDNIGMEPLPNGWYRCFLASTTIASPAAVPINIFITAGGPTAYLGDGVSGIYIADSQFNAGSTPGSYIDTLASAATVTDYVAGPVGQFTLSAAPLFGAILSWSGQGTAYASGSYAFLIDNQDMTITIGVAGDPPSATQLALLTGGYIALKPQSVDINYYISPTASGPLFGFDASNQYIAGFDQGSWGKIYP
jgi:hypothetical protein